MTMTRGIRNNNPGNIDYNPRNQWKGQNGIETGVSNPRFATFVSPFWGIRAIAKLLRNYKGKDGIKGIGAAGVDTCLEIAHRWAPTIENNTNAYAEALARRLKVRATQTIELTSVNTVIELVKGIIWHENGDNPYSHDEIARAVIEALK